MKFSDSRLSFGQAAMIIFSISLTWYVICVGATSTFFSYREKELETQMEMEFGSLSRFDIRRFKNDCQQYTAGKKEELRYSGCLGVTREGMVVMIDYTRESRVQILRPGSSEESTVEDMQKEFTRIIYPYENDPAYHCALFSMVTNDRMVKNEEMND